MKIAFIGQKGIPAVAGGVEKHVEKLATRLASLGHDVTVYVRSHYTDPMLSEYEGVKLVHLPSIRTKHLDAITHSLFATLHALFQPYDIIHFQSIGPSCLAILPRLFKPSARVLATFHSRDYFHRKWGFIARTCLQVAEYFACTIPEKTIISSETLWQYARRAYRREFIFIPNGAEVAHESSTLLLNQWGLRSKRYILLVSRLVGHKGIHYPIKAFQELERMTKLPNNYKLVIVGAHADTPEYEKYLKVMSQGFENIVFLGERTGKEIETLYSHAGLFVQPSEDEGLSLALLEAMGHGLLAIVSDIPANVDAVKNGSGVIFKSKDIESLKKELAYYINRPEEAEVIGKIARERVEKYYSWDAIAKQTRDIYLDALYLENFKKFYANGRSK